MPRIKAATGAIVLAEGPHRAARPLNVGEAPRLDASNDTDFRPDRALADGEVVTGAGWTIEAVTTPGHTANHGVRPQRGQPAVLRRSRDGLVDPVVAPGRRDERLHGVAREARGPLRADLPAGPRRRRARCAALRPALHPPSQGREASILHRLGKGEADIPTLVRAIYIGLDPRLVTAAGLSVLAHLEDLTARGVMTDGPPSIEGRYRLGA